MDSDRRRQLLRRTAWVVGTIVVAAVLLAAVIQSLDLRKPVAHFASKQMGRYVEIAGPLHLHLLSWNPSASIAGLRIANGPAPDSGDLFTARRIDVQLQLLSVFRRNFVLPRLNLDTPAVRLDIDEEGHGSWETQPPQPEPKKGTPPKIPTVREFLLSNGSFHFADAQHKISLDATVSADEGRGSDSRHAFRFEGHGQMNGGPLTVNATGGPLLNLDPGQPYDFEAHARATGTAIDIQGRVDHPFDLTQYHATARMEGTDVADLYYLSGLTLPNTPPYKLSATVWRNGTDWHMEQLAGSLGKSDVAGSIAVDTSGKTPMLTANLRSRRLNIADLAPSLGAPPSKTEAADASPQQRAEAQRMAAQKLLLPDAKLDVSRVRAMNGTLKYRADSIDIQKMPMKAVALDVRLENGVIHIDPVSFEFPQGRIFATASIDARSDVPKTDLDLRLTNLKLDQLVPHKTGAAPFDGTLQGRVRLSGKGRSVHDFASDADGDVTVVVPHGDVRSAFAELTGINVARGIGLLLAKGDDATPLRCGVASFKADNGTLKAQSLVFDTENVLITGGGSINLDDETLHLNIAGHPKKPRFTRLRAPILINGKLRSPGFSLRGEQLAAQAGVATALGVLLTPVAALLAFVDPGLAKDANCSALLSEAGARTASSGGAAAKPAKP